MNYKYVVGEKSYVLSLAEHEQVRAIIEDGQKGLAVLRGGKLIINISFIRTVNETEDATDTQIQQRDEMLRLPPDKRDQSFSGSFLPPQKYTGFSKAVDTNDRECENCKQIHYIPSNKRFCIPCSRKFPMEQNLK